MRDELHKELNILGYINSFYERNTLPIPPRETPKTYCRKCGVPMHQASKKIWKCPKCGKFEKVKAIK